MRVARFLLCAALVSVAANSWGSDGDKASRLFDADGWLDLSQFLDTAHGFVPLVSPITEPAVGYGAAAALIFIDRQTSAPQQRNVRPNIAAIGGAATENGTRGLFAGHLGTWRDGRLRTMAAIADAEVNLDFLAWVAIVSQAMRALAMRFAHAVASLAAAIVSVRPHYG
jgi:hypothetical protein